MYFRNYRLRKNGASECYFTNNMVNGHKHCWDLDDGTFNKFIDHCEHNSVGKSLC